MGLENWTANQAAIMLARSFLNPGRTMGHLLAFKCPWVRDTRMGILGENHEIRKELVREYREEGGGGGQGAARESAQWQFVAEINGGLVMHMPASNQSWDSLFYGVGQRWTPRAAQKISPYAQVLIGDDGALRSQLLTEWTMGMGHCRTIRRDLIGRWRGRRMGSGWRREAVWIGW